MEAGNCEMTARRTLLACLAALLALAGSNAWADYFRPAFLQLTEHAGGLYDVRWKTPAQSEAVITSIRPVFPTGSHMIQPLVSAYAAGSAVMVGQVKVPGGLEGKTIRFDGLADTGNQALVRFIRMDGSEDLYKVTPTQPELTIPKDPNTLSVSERYTQLGVEHILLGFDHLLFVTGLFMLVANLRTLFWTITSFTVAHSVTLALVTLGVIRVPVPPVEAFIALSIVFVAVEVARQAQGHATLASRKPWLVAFTFGLLHGLGFASALAQIGLPRNNLPLALLFFNVGVEVGQIAFVAALLVISNVARRLARPAQLSAGRLAACYGIGGMASYWLFDRISNFV
jgi:hydrogenase/urease accessory protein HupE